MQPPDGEGSRYQVLVVDDHDTFNDLLGKFLVDHSQELDIVRLLEAPDGASAVEVVDAHNPNLVLMDVNMPGMTGIEATRLMMAMSPGILVILVTLFPDRATRVLATKAGAMDLLGKSDLNESFLGVLRTALCVGSGREPPPKHAEARGQ